MLTVRAFEFVPSINGFQFSANDLPSPADTVSFTDGTVLALNAVTRNLGGGMSFATADYIRAQRAVYSASTAPVTTDPVYAYLVQRQKDNLDEAAIHRVLSVMSPDMPDYDAWQYQDARIVSRTRELLATELPAIRQDIDLHALSQVAIAEAVLQDPRQLGAAYRQVCAYSYDIMDDGSTVLHIYDPEFQLDDSVVLSVPLVDFTSHLALSYSHSDVMGFFRVPYSAVAPPA